MFLESSEGLSSQKFVHFSLWSVLQNQIDSGLVEKVAVHPQNVRMPQVGLNLNLSPQLVLQVRLLQLRFEEYLESDHELALLLSGEVHVAKFPPA